jgi:hypothetical protein
LTEKGYLQVYFVKKPLQEHFNHGLTYCYLVLMKRTASALTVALALMASIVLPMPLANANFVDFPIPSMGIISPPYPPNKYENSTVMLEIHVYA